MNSVSKILSLANKIIKGEYTKDNWRSILDSIAEIYGVDGAFIGFWENEKIEFKHSSFILEKSYPKDQFRDLYEIPLNARKHFHEKLLKNGFIAIKSYDKYNQALKPWKDIGLKSLLAVTIKSPHKLYGSVHLINLDKQKDFSEEEIKSLKIIADSIASELDKQSYIKQIHLEKERNIKQLELLKLLDNELKQSISIKFIAEALKKIKNMLNADKMYFLFASENLYFELNYDTFVGDIASSKYHPIYDVWKTNTTVISEICTPDQKERHTIFIPIVSLGETVAIFGFAFKKELDESFKTELDNITTALTHFVSIIHTYKNIKSVSSKLSDTEEGLIQAFVSTTEAKDIYTKGHSEHVAYYSRLIAKRLELDRHQQEMIYNAGLLHDIGKIGIPDMILLKPGKLTTFEYEIIKYHPLISYEIVKNIPKFKDIAMCIRHHHEKIDGSGYPDGLKSDKIELGAKILAIADIFDALTTERPYRKALSPSEAIKILKKEKIDQSILKKVEDDLMKSFIKGIPRSTFIPLEIENLRKEIIDLDFMTGLKRRKYLIKTMDKYISNVQPFTLFLVDIKNMSYINFRYGREVADRVILFVSEELRKLIKTQALSRVGADEFMFLYFQENAEAFKSILHIELKSGILKKIESSNCIITPEDAKKTIGCFITFARFPEEGKTSEELIYICSKKKKLESYKYHAKIPF